MSVNSKKISSLLSLLSHFDKDERYMAMSDLIIELELVSELDTTLQTYIRNATLKLLEDSSTECQTVAVKW